MYRYTWRSIHTLFLALACTVDKNFSFHCSVGTVMWNQLEKVLIVRLLWIGWIRLSILMPIQILIRIGTGIKTMSFHLRILPQDLHILENRANVSWFYIFWTAYWNFHEKKTTCAWNWSRSGSAGSRPDPDSQHWIVCMWEKKGKFHEILKARWNLPFPPSRGYSAVAGWAAPGSADATAGPARTWIPSNIVNFLQPIFLRA